ncbi:MAG: antitoxin VapB family protein [Candidatus Aenigmarchaeota archaeon]|nr:antitoxin VapB family protein [Candidatus Aenigmarchaeota archaeon]
MGFKTITIKESVYRELSGLKGKSESFSEFFEKLVKEKKGKPDLRKFYGSWKMGTGEWRRIGKIVKKRRTAAGKRYKEKLQGLFE